MLHVSLADMVVQAASSRQVHLRVYSTNSVYSLATVLLALTSCTWPSLVPKVLSGGLNRQFADNELFVHESL